MVTGREIATLAAWQPGTVHWSRCAAPELGAIEIGPEAVTALGQGQADLALVVGHASVTGVSGAGKCVYRDTRRVACRRYPALLS